MLNSFGWFYTAHTSSYTTPPEVSSHGFKGAEPSSTLQSFTDSRPHPWPCSQGTGLRQHPSHTCSAYWMLPAARGVGHSVLTLLIFLSGSSTQIGISLRLLNLPLPPILYQVPSCSPFNKQDLITSFSLVPSHENTAIITILKMIKTGME